MQKAVQRDPQQKRRVTDLARVYFFDACQAPKKFALKSLLHRLNQFVIRSKSKLFQARDDFSSAPFSIKWTT